MEKESLSILVIDPKPSDHQLIGRSMARAKIPARLSFVTSTSDGLKEMEKDKFDLVLTDHFLPYVNAFHLLQELQKRHLLVPVIVLTHDDEARVAREAFQRGADDYLLKEELEAISLFDVIGDAIEKRRRREDEKEQALLLRQQAERDGLTGLYNHRYFLEALEKEFARARRYRRPLSLLMIDLDGFKTLNDTCGHPQGDKALRQTATLILQSVRFVDLVARYGGDEFALLFPETDIHEAVKIAGRLLHEVRKSPFLFEGRVFPLSASIGVACCRPSHGSAGTLLREADRALYDAKKNGRGRSVTFHPETQSEKGGGSLSSTPEVR